MSATENSSLTTGCVSDTVRSHCNKALHDDTSIYPLAQAAQLQPFASLWWRNLHSVWRRESVLGRLWCPHTQSAQKLWDRSKGLFTALLVNLSQAVKPQWQLCKDSLKPPSQMLPKFAPCTKAPELQGLEFICELLSWYLASQFPSISIHIARRSVVLSTQPSACQHLGWPSALEKLPALSHLTRQQSLLPRQLRAGSRGPSNRRHQEGLTNGPGNFQILEDAASKLQSLLTGTGSRSSAQPADQQIPSCRGPDSEDPAQR